MSARPERPRRPERGGRLALALIALSVVLQVVVGHLGPSVAVPPISAAHDHDRLANPWLVTALLAFALTAGAVGLLLAFRALRGGWRPSPTRLLVGAVLAVMVLLLGPPLGTADLGGYAAYGRMAVLDRDPFTTTPRQLAGDPVADAAEDPWRDIQSIYGPVATAEFHLAAAVGGPSREKVLRILLGASGVAFLLTALLLDRVAARAGPDGRRWAALLWALNPLLLHQLVAGGHLDALLTLLVLAGVLVLARGFAGGGGPGGPGGTGSPGGTAVAGWRSSALSGVVLGLAGLVKATAAAPAAGLAAAHLLVPGRRGRRPLAAFVAAGTAVAALGYAAVGGLHALGPTRDAGRFVSRGTPWRFVASGLERLMPQDAARTVVGMVAVVVAAWLARRVFRALPGGEAGTVLSGLPVRAALASSTAWLVVAPYSLPWYDAVAWALLAVFVLGRRVVTDPAVERLRDLLLLHTAVLSVAYLPGRVVGLPGGIGTAQDVVRGALAPVVVLVVAIGLARLRPAGSTPGVRSAPPEDPAAEDRSAVGRLL